MSGPSLSDGLGLLRSQLFFHPPPIKTSFAGQTVLVTGGNAGLGREAVKQLLEHGVDKVILACRNLSKGEAAKQELQAQTSGKAIVEVWQLDMASFASVKAFGERISQVPRLDAAIENAGIWPAQQASAEGFEETLTTNVISTMLLAHLLLPKLQETADKYKTTTRLSFVSSTLHKFATLKARKDTANSNIFDALTAQRFAKPEDWDARYNDSKLLLQMYAARLSKLYEKKHGKGVAIVVLSPGYCMSKLRPPRDFQQRMIERTLARTTEEGGRAFLDSIDVLKADSRHGVSLSDYNTVPHSSWIGTKDGQHTSDRVWKDLNDILDRAAPGLTASI